MATETTPATPTKLRTGAWGAKTTSPVASGDVITIRTRGGKTWDARVTRILWTDGTACLVATESLARPATAQVRTWGGRTRRTSRRDAELIEDMGHGYVR